MKSILYVGATLMIGASIYEFVDYNNNYNKKEFKNLYAEKEITQPVVEKKKASANTEKVEIISENKTIAAEKQVTDNSTKVNSKEVKTKKHNKRVFKPELFSRGALDEKYFKVEIKAEIPKTKPEPSKTENKDQ